MAGGATFTPENGATAFIPGSQREAHYPTDKEVTEGEKRIDVIHFDVIYFDDIAGSGLIECI